ncbi:hypothetical protein [Streptomyces sp. NPDC098781]|uniref:hypothetical protein n=1 Tax=Streptomyces sp. NPDC098781 TaxID=3366097 RepID=UPI003822D8CD
MAVPDLITGDLHGLGLALGVFFILGAPVTVTAISLLEMGRLRSRYGIRLADHPAVLPPMPMPMPTPTPMPPPPPYAPNGFVPPQGNPYAPGPQPPYTAPQQPYTAPQQPYSPPPPYNPR